jgi:surface polysaccharide O-acyltransferase-like enzyme
MNRIAWTDNLRVFALFAVILMHAVPNMMFEEHSTSEEIWWVANFFTSLCRFCVPVFVMLTGMLVIPKYRNLNDFLKKLLVRIILPFIFWSIVYIALNLLVIRDSQTRLSINLILKAVINLFRSPVTYHLWYIYMITGIYLIIPVISRWISGSTGKEIVYFLLLCFFSNLFCQPLFIKYSPGISLIYFSGYLGYAVLGYYLYRESVTGNKNLLRTVGYLLVLTGITITFFGTFLITKSKGCFRDYFYSYLSPNVLLLTAGIFLVFSVSKGFINKSNLVTGFISRYSYGIYLSHVFCMFWLDKIGLNWKLTNPFLSIPLTGLCCLIISGFLVFILSKAPLGRYISG